jgi:dTDP-4-dehydrorhamnose 3,5-epimerase
MSDGSGLAQLTLSGVGARPCERRHDERGWISVSEREASGQHIVVRSRRGVLRGAYVHPAGDVHLTLIDGSALAGLHDLRPSSATYGRALTVGLGERNEVSALRVPAGVAHALWFTTDTLHTLSSDAVIDDLEEHVCRWDDPGLGFRWQPVDPIVSAHDAAAGSLNALRTGIAAALR